MSAAVRERGLLVAVGFPIAALLAVSFWLYFRGASLTTSVPAAVVLIALTALASQLEVVISPRGWSSPAGAFYVAAGLVGGPLVGALAGASNEAFSLGTVWRKRSAWTGAGALQGFVAGLIGLLALSGVRGILALATLELLVGFLLNTLFGWLVLLDRGVKVRPAFSESWRPVLLTWLLPGPPLVAFLYLFQSAAVLALAVAAGTLLLLFLANRVRLQLEQSLAEERLRSRHDALTGAPNRYALADALQSEQARIMRGDRSAAVCFLDLDLFREVNNHHGYSAGDQLLVSVYQRLRDHLRASDQVFRWGGEEFVILAPRTDVIQLADLTERLRLLVANQPFPIDGQQLGITCSVGAALLHDSRSPEATLEVASRLVRIAKQKRNSIEVEVADSLRRDIRAVAATR